MQFLFHRHTEDNGIAKLAIYGGDGPRIDGRSSAIQSFFFLKRAQLVGFEKEIGQSPLPGFAAAQKPA